MLDKLRSGVMLDDGPAHFDDIRDAGGQGYNHWYHVVLREGRNREVRRLWEAVDVKVSRLIRVRYGSIMLPRSLRAGKTQELDNAEVAALGNLVGLELGTPKKVSVHKRAPGAPARKTRAAGQHKATPAGRPQAKKKVVWGGRRTKK
jgi:23S rRNA pseudouridine2605 synthase